MPEFPSRTGRQTIKKNLSTKEESNTENLTETLMEELSCETVFSLPVVGGISESVVVTWIIMAVLVVVSLLLTRNLSVENPGKVQLMLESGISWAQDFFEGIIGKEAKRYGPYLITVLIYLAAANTLAPLFGFKPPTKDLNRAGSGRGADHSTGDRDPAAVALYATLRKHAGRVRGAGTSEVLCAADRAHPGKFLF